MFAEKGCRNYLKGKRIKYSLIITGLILVIVGFVVLGYVLNGDTKNIYTIMAVLTALPFANLLTVLIASAPYKAPGEEEYMMIAGENKPECLLTELIITSSKLKSIYFPYIFINEDQVFAYTLKLPADKKEYEEYIEGLLAATGIQAKVHIYTEMTSFKRIAKQNSDRTEISNFEKRVAKGLLAVSM